MNKASKYSVGHSPITFIWFGCNLYTVEVGGLFSYWIWVFVFIMQEIFLQKKFKKPWCGPTPEYHSRQLFLSLQRKHLPAQWIIVIVQEETTTIDNITGRDALISSLCCFRSLLFLNSLAGKGEQIFPVFASVFSVMQYPQSWKDSVPASFWVLAQRTRWLIWSSIKRLWSPITG